MGRGTVNKTQKSEAIDLLMRRCDAPNGFPPADMSDLSLGVERMTLGRWRNIANCVAPRKRRQATGEV